MNLYTAGYEGLTIDAFIARLKQAGIDRVLDVREYPLSRKKGFSKNAFARDLAAQGIAYEHNRSLGCPKPIRKQYKEDGDWNELVCIAAQQRICMVCYEADARFCHRSLIAEAALELKPSLDIQHLPFKTTLFDDRLLSVA